MYLTSDQLAKTFFDSKKFDLAAKQAEITVELNNTDAILFNAARCHYYNRDISMALKRINEAIEKNDRVIDYWREKALYLTWNGEFDRSEKIIHQLPNEPKKIFNLGWHAIRKGNFLKGMELVEEGRKGRCWGNADLVLKTERWQGQDVKGKTVLLISEAGLGDEMIFARFAPMVADLGAKVHVRCTKTMVDLFKRLDKVHSVDQWPDMSEHDYWAPFMSLPAIMKLNSPYSKPYLTPNPDYINKWSKILGSGKKIAIRWQGNPQFEQDQRRTLDPNILYDMAKQYGTIYSVQKESNIPCPSNVINLGDRLETWEDTAAVLSLIDCVLTSCTSIPHLSGALGAQTIIITPIVAYFTWGLPGEKSDWYDSVLIARQTNPYNWDDAYFQAEKHLRRVFI